MTDTLIPPTDPVYLADILSSVRAGVWGSGKPTAERPIAVRVVRNGDITADRRIRYDRLPVRYVSPSELEHARIGDRDIVLVSSGDIGKSARLDPPYRAIR